MTEKSKVEVVIGKKILTLSGYESEAYLQKVASYINRKIQELESTREFRYVPSDLKPVLIEINITDELMKAREQVEQLETDLQMKNNELAEIKHELVEAQMKLDELESKQASKSEGYGKR